MINRTGYVRMDERCEVINLKRNTGRYFLKIFIMSFFIVVLLLSAGVLSYKAVMHFWQPKEDSTVAYQNETLPEKSSRVVIEEISKNLIICYDKSTKNITKIVLEILNSHSKQLTYVTVPVRTELTLSGSLYKKMIIDCPEVPQVLKLSTLSKYLVPDKAFEYEVLIIENLLGIKISYYTAIPSDTYDTIFTQKSVKKAGFDAVSMEVFSKDFNSYLETLTSRDALAAYLEEIYASIDSSLALKDKKKYLDYYSEALPEHVSFELIEGYNQNSAYTIDMEDAAQQLSLLTAE